MDMFEVRIVKRSESFARSSSAERVPVLEGTKSRRKGGADALMRLDARPAMEDPQRRLGKMTWPQPKSRIR